MCVRERERERDREREYVCVRERQVRERFRKVRLFGLMAHQPLIVI